MSNNNNNNKLNMPQLIPLPTSTNSNIINTSTSGAQVMTSYGSIVSSASNTTNLINTTSNITTSNITNNNMLNSNNNGQVLQRVQTIQLTPQKQQQLKNIQLQIQTLNNRLQQLQQQSIVGTPDNNSTQTMNEIQLQLQRLFNEQTKILATGKLLSNIPTIQQIQQQQPTIVNTSVGGGTTGLIQQIPISQIQQTVPVPVSVVSIHQQQHPPHQQTMFYTSTGTITPTIITSSTNNALISSTSTSNCTSKQLKQQQQQLQQVLNINNMNKNILTSSGAMITTAAGANTIIFKDSLNDHIISNCNNNDNNIVIGINTSGAGGAPGAGVGVPTSVQQQQQQQHHHHTHIVGGQQQQQQHIIQQQNMCNLNKTVTATIPTITCTSSNTIVNNIPQQQSNNNIIRPQFLQQHQINEMNKATNTAVCNTSSISPVSTANSSNVITVQTSLPNIPPMSVNNDNKRNQVVSTQTTSQHIDFINNKYQQITSQSTTLPTSSSSNIITTNNNLSNQKYHPRPAVVVSSASNISQHQLQHPHPHQHQTTIPNITLNTINSSPIAKMKKSPTITTNNNSVQTVPIVTSAQNTIPTTIKDVFKPQLPPPVSRPALFEQQLTMDQQEATNPDIHTPFQSKSDACKRLVRYHCMNQPVLSQKDLDKADEIFELTARHFIDKFYNMVNKYKTLRLMESMREVPTSELMMIDRMFIAGEQQELEKLRAEKLQKDLENDLLGTSTDNIDYMNNITNLIKHEQQQLNTSSTDIKHDQQQTYCTTKNELIKSTTTTTENIINSLEWNPTKSDSTTMLLKQEIKSEIQDSSTTNLNNIEYDEWYCIQKELGYVTNTDNKLKTEIKIEPTSSSKVEDDNTTDKLKVEDDIESNIKTFEIRSNPQPPLSPMINNNNKRTSSVISGGGGTNIISNDFDSKRLCTTSPVKSSNHYHHHLNNHQGGKDASTTYKINK
ncbi:putative uncharacterized protein DDB_G0286901 [Chrysoperla carnea]|uniref:putative uncharacterized protein DDB_G0286901 n=1 Tax=Chrysoperla carnea TaxID=189513 RepID=UPI001D096645|nr:putative uncharacterized protein DDB_G0286901 [Chrysoperla carnea]